MLLFLVNDEVFPLYSWWSSHLTFSAAVAELWPAEVCTVQRYWPWFPGRALEMVSTEPPGPILALSINNKNNSSDAGVKVHTACAPLTLQWLVIGSFPLHWFHCTSFYLAPKADRLPLAHSSSPRLHRDDSLARNCTHRYGVKYHTSVSFCVHILHYIDTIYYI